MIIVLMGPSGAGKSTVGRVLADALGWEFVEGDAFHSPGNVAAMRAGIPLDDVQRGPWLRALAAGIRLRLDAGRDAVFTCSALRRAYREALAPNADGAVRFVYLRASRALLEQRVQGRDEHFFPPELLQSQLDTLEPPRPGDDVLTLDADQPPLVLAERIRAALGIRPADNPSHRPSNDPG